LWRSRVADPENLRWVEYLCWLDIRLIRACPDAVSPEDMRARPDVPRFFGVSAFATLMELYTREGLLEEAMKVARIAEEFEQGEHFVADLEERFRELQAEDAL
jgi:hypothetical protein